MVVNIGILEVLGIDFLTIQNQNGGNRKELKLVFMEIITNRFMKNFYKEKI